MRINLILLVLALSWFCSHGQRSDTRADIDAKNSTEQLSLIHDIEEASGHRYIYTDTTYASSNGKRITIQNSYPKGGDIEPGTTYTDSKGRKYFFVAFWTRVINGTDDIIEFKVNFPAVSFPLTSTSDAYLKLFIPPNTMSIDKLSLYNYGLTGMKSFLDTNFNNATQLQRIIKPNEAYIFYTIGLAHQAGGPARSAIILKEKELFYSITMGTHGSVEIPCGTIAFIKEDGKQP